MSDYEILSENHYVQALMGPGWQAAGPSDAGTARLDRGGVIVERSLPGKPHSGKVFVAIHAHLDDIPYYCAGTVAKLIQEGYKGYIIRTSNDEKCGEGTPS